MPKFTQSLAIFFLVFFLCSPSPAKDKPSAFGSLATYLTEHHEELSPEKYLTVSEVFLRLPPEKRRGLVKHLLVSIFEKANLPPMIQKILEHSFQTKLTGQAASQLAEGKEDSINQLVELLFQKFKLDTHPQILDQFPTIPIEEMEPIQQALFSAGKPNASPPTPRAFRYEYPDDGWREITLRKKGCARLQRNYQPVARNYGLYSGMEPKNNFTVECFAQNSIAIAKVLNVLANTIDGEETPPIRLRWEEQPQKVKRISSYQDLYEALLSFGFTLELFNTRVPVNFAGLSFFDGKEHYAIRMPTFFDLPLSKGQRVRVPAEHGEIDFMVRFGGTRIAEAQWFFGVPSKSFDGLAAFWRPHLFLQASWAGYVHERVSVFHPEDRHPSDRELEKYFLSAAFVMKGFQAVYDRYRPPFNAYGLFICSDSMTFALVKHDGAFGDKKLSERVTHAFPTLYARTLLTPNFSDVSNGRVTWTPTSLINRFAEYAKIPADQIANFAKADTELVADPQAMKKRLQLAFSPKDDWRLKPFPEFLQKDLKIIRE